MSIREMQEQRSRLVEGAQSKLLEIKDDTTDERSAEIEAEADRMLDEAESLRKKIERQQRIDTAKASLQDGDDRRPGQNGQRGSGEETPPQDVTYRDAFHAYLRNGGNVHELAPETRAALQAHNAETRMQTAGSDAAGGFLVPDEATQAIVKAMALWGPMYDADMSTQLNTTGGGTLPIPTVDDTASRADQEANEGDTPLDDGSGDIVIGRVTLEDYLFMTPFLKWSLQLATGSFTGVESLIADLLGERLGRTANDALTNGSGVSTAQGVVQAASLGKVTAGVAVAPEEIQELVHSVDPAYRGGPKTRMMFNDNTLLALSKLKDGQGNFLIDGNNANDDEIKVGRTKVKFKINQAMADIASGNDPMVYGDFSRYYTRRIGNPIIGLMQDSKFWPGYGMAGYLRIDGALPDTTAIKRLRIS